MAAKYDPESEAEVVGWIKQLLGHDVERGPANVQRALKNGVYMVELCQKVQAGCANIPPKAKKMRLKPNTQSAPFKQMENIQTFLTFCENMGIPKVLLFPTIDLYENRNMAGVLSGIQLLGTECQRYGFNGPTIGAAPTEQNVREFDAETLAKGKTVIGLQAGTNKCASQSGMSMGGVRHIADIKADDFDRSGAGIIGLQAGSNKGASQSGMAMGGARHAADIRADDMDKAGASVLSGQTGYNKGASQSGMAMGGARHAADIRADDLDKTGQSIIGLQAGSNKGASQSGMVMGGARHAADIRADQMDATGQSVIGLQMGSNKGASQTGMAMGGVRHAADIRADQMDKAGQGVINLQYGSNEGASQAGMSYGAIRHVTDSH